MVSLSKYFVMWDKMPMWWDERRRHCDVASGYYWPSDDTSEGGSSVSSDPGSLSHDDVDGWMSGTDTVKGWGNLVFSDLSWPEVTETMDMKGLLYTDS